MIINKKAVAKAMAFLRFSY